MNELGNAVTSTSGVVGAGGHARVVIDAFRTQGCGVICVFDDNPELQGQIVGDAQVVGPSTQARIGPLAATPLHVAIGDNRTRKTMAERLGPPWSTAIHATAWISKSAAVGSGTLVGARAVIQSAARIGEHVIVNTAAVIEHDVVVESFAHIASGAILAGGSSIGEGTLIGSGAVVLPGVRVGKWCVLGAGAVVLDDVADDTTAAGVPARQIRPADRRDRLR